MKKLWDLKKVFSNLELEGQGHGIIMGVTRLLLLGPFYTIQTKRDQTFCTRVYYRVFTTLVLPSYRKCSSKTGKFKWQNNSLWSFPRKTARKKNIVWPRRQQYRLQQPWIRSCSSHVFTIPESTYLRIYESLNFLCFVFLYGRSFLLRSNMPI